MAITLQSGSHTRYDLKYHFVRCLKYCRVALNGNRGLYPARITYEVAKRYDFEVIELGVTADLVHLFASAPPDMAPAKIMQVVKSITARAMFRKLLGLKRKLRGALWARGYFVMNSGEILVIRSARRGCRRARRDAR